MENKDLLDDNLDWDTEINAWAAEADADSEAEGQSVTMLQTFNTEQEADVAVALLAGEGIVARVVSSITGGMTPFAYGNVRLFVAASQREAAAEILRKMTQQNAETTHELPAPTAGHILVMIVFGLFAIGLIIRLLQKAFGAF